MKIADIKPAAIMISVCALIGVAIDYFAGFYWLTAMLIAMIAVLINGLVIFNEDLEPDGFDYEAGVTDTKQAKAEQRKANLIQVSIIIALVIGAIWSHI
ncbi:hypothetical protein [Shewanella sedimentimangrovi]|uniref:Uncharacterized protein n=1 Tax=Shewanella sedimentimangrovi TaxID=2814293 RepID=A0ABX7R4A4_9GAMM|nr:hypothetical protein [Shewanella sedimentimangrovi]QSX38314.1 hypothetical protein JYB85_05675 [Shewanella sedimentimangrovi]